MGNKILKEKTEKSNSKGHKSKHPKEQLEAYARSKATAFQNGEGR